MVVEILSKFKRGQWAVVRMRVSELVIASSNSNKILELKTVAREFGVTLYSPKEIQSQLNLEEMPEVEETGETYFENALLKAKAVSNWLYVL